MPIKSITADLKKCRLFDSQLYIYVCVCICVCVYVCERVYLFHDRTLIVIKIIDFVRLDFNF